MVYQYIWWQIGYCHLAATLVYLPVGIENGWIVYESSVIITSLSSVVSILLIILSPALLTLLLEVTGVTESAEAEYCIWCVRKCRQLCLADWLSDTLDAKTEIKHINMQKCSMSETWGGCEFYHIDYLCGTGIIPSPLCWKDEINARVHYKVSECHTNHLTVEIQPMIQPIQD